MRVLLTSTGVQETVRVITLRLRRCTLICVSPSIALLASAGCGMINPSAIILHINVRTSTLRAPRMSQKSLTFAI